MDSLVIVDQYEYDILFVLGIRCANKPRFIGGRINVVIGDKFKEQYASTTNNRPPQSHYPEFFKLLTLCLLRASAIGPLAPSSKFYGAPFLKTVPHNFEF